MTFQAEDMEEHDLSLLQQHYAQQKRRSTANLLLKGGAGGALLLTGAGLMFAGASLIMQPEIIEVPKIVTETKVERVEIPKIVTETKIVELPKLIDHERVVQAPAPPPAPTPQPSPKNLMPGEKMAQADFEQTKMFREASKCHGRLISHHAGILKFADGSECYDVYPSGERDTRFSTTRNDGDPTVCNVTGEVFPNGKSSRRCYALHNGKVEDIADQRRAWLAQHSGQSNSRDSMLDELFDNIDNFDGPGG